jgi:hypothetical protein
LITTAFTVSSFLYFSDATFQGFSIKALIERETFSLFISIIFAFTLSPTLKVFFKLLIKDHEISEI